MKARTEPQIWSVFWATEARHLRGDLEDSMFEHLSHLLTCCLVILKISNELYLYYWFVHSARSGIVLSTTFYPACTSLPRT